METPSTPPSRKKGAEIPLGRRYAMAVEYALAIPPGKVRLPKGPLGPLAARYGVCLEYPTKLWKNCRSQIDDTQELDLSQKPRSGRPSLLTPTKVAALRAVSKQNRTFTNAEVAEQLKAYGLDFGTETVRRWFKEGGARKVGEGGKIRCGSLQLGVGLPSVQ